MRVLLTADDFGFDDDTVDATIACFERGGLTSATIMPKMGATARAIAYARSRPELSFGVHLTYAGDGLEGPVLRPSLVPSLVGDDGMFLQSNRTRVLALTSRLSVAEIERETAAQIELLLDHGVRLSHVDSHGHLHKFGPFRAALERVLPKFGIRRVRNVQDVFVGRPLKSFTYWFGPLWRRRLMARFATTSHFFMPLGAPDERWTEPVLATLTRSTDDTLEIGVHPGSAEPWRAEQRAAAEAFASEARRRGHQLVGWGEL